MEGALCCCGSGKKHGNCCGIYLSGRGVPDTPEQLMRSRYAAFCHKNIDYLIATRDPDERQINDRKVLADTCNRTQWLGLEVLNTDDSQLGRGIGFVEFAAFYEEKGQVHENSRFVKKAAAGIIATAGYFLGWPGAGTGPAGVRAIKNIKNVTENRNTPRKWP
jgi:uncharacterized protein YchJ